MKNTSILFLLILGTFFGCDIYPQDEYEEFYVVESYIVAGRNLQQVRLSTTGEAFEFYSFENTAVSNASVSINLLNTNSNRVEQSFPFQMDTPGIYIPTIDHEVLPERTYQLLVSVPNGASFDEISATAIVPGSFDVIGGVQDTLVYQSTEQLEVTLSESSYPGRQNVYVFNTLALNPIPENLTPLYADFYDNEEEIDSNGVRNNDLLLEFSNTSSGLLNAGNFTINNDGSITIRYPWLAVAFFEENRIVATTVDDNIYDYIRSGSVQFGGSTLSPGEIQNVITHIEGGIGLFGAMASDTIPTFFKRNPLF
tara:strand:- start:2509 stop:3441 length:933 start_codon:yes stop_codon:yes gene_type:complete